MRVLAYLLMILALVTLAPWALMAMMSPMVFDSGETPQLWAFVWALMLYPVWLIAWLVFALRGVRAGLPMRSVVLSVLAVAPALVLAVAVGVSSIK